MGVVLVTECVGKKKKKKRRRRRKIIKIRVVRRTRLDKETFTILGTAPLFDS